MAQLLAQLLLEVSNIQNFKDICNLLCYERMSSNDPTATLSITSLATRASDRGNIVQCLTTSSLFFNRCSEQSFKNEIISCCSVKRVCLCECLLNESYVSGTTCFALIEKRLSYGMKSFATNESLWWRSDFECGRNDIDSPILRVILTLQFFEMLLFSSTGRVIYSTPIIHSSVSVLMFSLTLMHHKSSFTINDHTDCCW